VQHSRVESIQRLPDGSWRLDCGPQQGSIDCAHFVNAGGLWAREVGRMCGLELPVLAMEHMYLVTEPVPGLEEAPLFHAMDFGGEVYLRKEGPGLLLGTYERHGVPWSPQATPWDFGHQLLTPDLDRISENLAVAFDHFPVFRDVGIRSVVNGPFTFAPDGNPLVGPVRGQPGHWVACGVMAGLSQSGGVGLTLANWITQGDPGTDVWGMDVARFGDWATPSYTNAKVRENYGRRFRIAYPNEQLPAARPLLTSPIYDRLDTAKAVWGASYGLEHALWFQPASGPSTSKPRIENATLRRSNAWTAVAEECRAVREGVGLIETTNFAKYEFSGDGARDYLDRVLANRLPKPGRMALTPMLNEHGRLIGDFTVASLPPSSSDDGPERLLVFGSGAAERYHQRWFDAHLPEDGTVRYRSLGTNLTGLSIAGPASRDLLAELTTADVSPESLRFLDIRRLDVSMVPALVARISFTGDLGYELWVEPAYLARLFDQLMNSGRRHEIRLFGAHALNALRLEKSFGTWATEYRPVYDPYEAGLAHFVKPDKGEFIGREAVEARRDKGPGRQLVTFTVDTPDGPDGADVIGDEPIWHNGQVIGRVTSGGYAHASGASVAMGYIPTGLPNPSAGFEIEVLGHRCAATRLDECLFDAPGKRMRI
jgi:dimethylglycine dehydrogenase